LIVKRKTAFTLIELLVVVAIIALLISILLPSLSRARELSKRTICAANLRGIGQACKVYSNDNEDYWPIAWPYNIAPTQVVPIAQFDTTNSIGKPELRDRTQPKITTTACFWLLVQGGGVSTKQFVCPSSGDVTDSTTTLDAYKDFSSDQSVSYGYQWPWAQEPSSTAPRPGLAYAYEGRDSNMALTADRGPFGTAGGYDTTQGEPEACTFDDNSSPSFWSKFNSANHQREGQNVGYQDAHVEFQKRPIAGVNNENIYTVWQTTYPITTHLTEAAYFHGYRLVYGTDASGRLPRGNTDAAIWP
jgi:prepilin-type N-terminal cleavage/methylation domain-containing protein